MVIEIVNDIINVVKAHGDDAFLIAMIIMLLDGSCQCIRTRAIQKIKFGKLLLRGMFVFYLAVLLRLTLLERSHENYAPPNLILFSTLDASKVDIRFAIENIILVIPFGAMVCLIGSNKAGVIKVTLCSFLLSACIEMTQYMTRCGHFELDDILFNTLGGLLGWLMISAASMIVTSWRKKLL